MCEPQETTPAEVRPAGTLPEWSEDLDTELRAVYFAAPPEVREGEPSRHRGLKAVYEWAKDLAEGRTQWPPPDDQP